MAKHEAPSCAGKMKLLHNLLGAVIKNTKAATDGKVADGRKEQMAAKRLLHQLLGRKPSDSEIKRVLADGWSDSPGDCCKN